MPADVTRLDLRLRRRSTIGYAAAGMALYTLVVVALYPSFKNSTSLNSLSGSTAAALFGVTGPLTSPGGWLNGNIYGNFFPPEELAGVDGAVAQPPGQPGGDTHGEHDGEYETIVAGHLDDAGDSGERCPRGGANTAPMTMTP